MPVAEWASRGSHRIAQSAPSADVGNSCSPFSPIAIPAPRGSSRAISISRTGRPCFAACEVPARRGAPPRPLNLTGGGRQRSTIPRPLHREKIQLYAVTVVLFSLDMRTGGPGGGGAGFSAWALDAAPPRCRSRPSPSGAASFCGPPTGARAPQPTSADGSDRRSCRRIPITVHDRGSEAGYSTQRSSAG